MKKPSQARWNRCVSHAGFTLIELLTVIAIIAVLAGLTAVAIPQYLQKAQETKTVANMRDVGNKLQEFTARIQNTSGFPPAYGFILPESKDEDVTALTDEDHVLVPYTYTIGIHNEEALAQVGWYATTRDLNSDGLISLAEYMPIGEREAATGGYNFSTELYGITTNTPVSGSSFNEIPAQLNGEYYPPYAYIPFNKRQLQALRRYWLDDAIRDELGAGFDPSNAAVAGRLFFPPAQYDGFVLIGSGPQGNDGGILSVAPPGTPGTDYPERHAYHMLALRIAFLATRDMDPDYDSGPMEADGLYDLSFQDRQQSSQIHMLPDGTNGQGPFIRVID